MNLKSNQVTVSTKFKMMERTTTCMVGVPNFSIIYLRKKGNNRGNDGRDGDIPTWRFQIGSNEICGSTDGSQVRFSED